MIYIYTSKQKIERKAPITKLTNELLHGEIDDFNFIKIEGTPENVLDIISEMSSLPFGSDKKVVIIESPFFLKDKEPKFVDERDGASLLQALENPVDDVETIFSVNEDEYSKDANQYSKAVFKIGKFVKIEEKDIVSRIIDRCTKRNVTIERKAAEELAARVNNDLNAMINETNKLCLYCDTITVLDVTKLVAKPLEDNVFAISNALIKGQNLLAFDIYRDLKVKNVEPIMIISLLANQFRLINQAKYLSSQGYSYFDVAKELKINEMRAKIVMQNAKTFSSEKISNILVELANLDNEIKSGQVDRFYSFELFLIKFKRN